jgi:septum formation protein
MMRAFGACDIILASASQSRAALLAKIGLDFRIEAADVDEESIKSAMIREGSGHAQIAAVLAALKAVQISEKYPDVLVIGADQILSAKGILYSKPVDIAEARRQLQALSGAAHELLTAVALAREGRIIWRHLETARLQMLSFSDKFIDDYLEKIGPAALTTVGCYQLEGQGPLLFEHISGDYYAILGLPLLPLLAELRHHQVIAA